MNACHSGYQRLVIAYGEEKVELHVNYGMNLQEQKGSNLDHSLRCPPESSDKISWNNSLIDIVIIAIAIIL